MGDGVLVVSPPEERFAGDQRPAGRPIHADYSFKGIYAFDVVGLGSVTLTDTQGQATSSTPERHRDLRGQKGRRRPHDETSTHDHDETSTHDDDQAAADYDHDRAPYNHHDRAKTTADYDNCATVFYNNYPVHRLRQLRFRLLHRLSTTSDLRGWVSRWDRSRLVRVAPRVSWR